MKVIHQKSKRMALLVVGRYVVRNSRVLKFEGARIRQCSARMTYEGISRTQKNEDCKTGHVPSPEPTKVPTLIQESKHHT